MHYVDLTAPAPVGRTKVVKDVLGVLHEHRIIESLENLGIVVHNPVSLKYELNKSKVTLLEAFL